jgi:hypothetical protein
MATGGGNDTRSSALPAQDASSADQQPPDYNFADEMPFPDEIGVRRGGSLDDVGRGVQGIAFYADMIGFGGPSSGLTQSMGRKPFPMGVNHYVRTMTKCSNGADMWVYVNGIPKGNLFGNRVQQALQRLNMPNLRGLAPGILEDARDALNPVPVMNAVFGTGYAKCKQVTLPVGTAEGRLKNVDGKDLIREAYPGDIKNIGNRPHQTRFVFDRWLTKEEWDKESQGATHCPDGSLIANHDENDCKKPILRVEGFTGSSNDAAVPVALLLALAAALWVRYSRD